MKSTAKAFYVDDKGKIKELKCKLEVFSCEPAEQPKGEFKDGKIIASFVLTKSAPVKLIFK